ncbi:ATP-dependent DNA helicase [Capilliphycus salinus ALCB114379]|uniref:ATP-dependent DNA helicase n=1 Tax=Capilliphycus salinus TaxID=2768948 RepID=UPI0039A40776
MIEVEAHNLLQSFLRSRRVSVETSPGKASWPHYLTMARLVARALRLGRSALIQTGVAPVSHHHSYRFSYLIPVLIWSEPALIVAPQWLLTELQQEEIPQLFDSQALDSHLDKSIIRGEVWPAESNFDGVLLTTPEEWLSDRLGGEGRFPANIPTIIDGVDDLEAWTRQQLTACIQPQDWTQLLQQLPQHTDIIRSAKILLTQAIFQRPANPYHCHLLDQHEQGILEQFYHDLFEVEASAIAGVNDSLTPEYRERWSQFWHQWQAEEQLRWVKVNRHQGTFSLYCSPANVSSSLSEIWPHQPVVLIGGALDLEKTAPTYRQLVGLEEITCVKFSPDRNSQLIQLYLPSGLPLPNTPKFQGALIEEIRGLLSIGASIEGLTVLLIEDTPLRTQIGAVFAGELGSRVQVETTKVDGRGILVAGWEFWRQHQGILPPPHLLAIATLPLPSLEHPLVAGRVGYYKQNHLDWFRLYLLPTALNELQRAVAPVRDSQGIVALFDSRVLHRSYGEQVLAALSPMARIDYLDTTWLSR